MAGTINESAAATTEIGKERFQADATAFGEVVVLIASISDVSSPDPSIERQCMISQRRFVAFVMRHLEFRNTEATPRDFNSLGSGAYLRVSADGERAVDRSKVTRRERGECPDRSVSIA